MIDELGLIERVRSTRIQVTCVIALTPFQRLRMMDVNTRRLIEDVSEEVQSLPGTSDVLTLFRCLPLVLVLPNPNIANNISSHEATHEKAIGSTDEREAIGDELSLIARSPQAITSVHTTQAPREVHLIDSTVCQRSAVENGDSRAAMHDIILDIAAALRLIPAKLRILLLDVHSMVSYYPK